MSKHRDPNDDRPQHYGDYAGAIVVTGLFLFGAVASVVALLALIFSNWLIIVPAVVFGAFVVAIIGNAEAAVSAPVVNAPTNTDMISGRVL